MTISMRAIPVILALLLGLSPAGAAAQNARFDEAFKAYQNDDYATALYYWQQLADEGNGPAQYNLGIMYLYGRGVVRDLAIAYKWFLLARDRHMEDADKAVAQLESQLSPSDMAKGLTMRDEWRHKHGF
jgi:TPR repeat protein